MTAVREAIVIPAIFLTVALVAGAEAGDRVTFAAPPVFALVLAILLIGTLVRSGALAPHRLLHGSRGLIANANGFIAVAALFAAAAQVFSMLTPRAGLPMLFVDIFLFVLLLNTWIVTPVRERLLQSLAVTLGSALLLKFVLLAALSSPDHSRTARVLTALFDLATFGTVAQPPLHPAAGYVAFAAIVLFLAGVALLPRQRSASAEMGLMRH